MECGSLISLTLCAILSLFLLPRCHQPDKIETVLDEATAEATKLGVSHLVSTIDIHFKIGRRVGLGFFFFFFLMRPGQGVCGRAFRRSTPSPSLFASSPHRSVPLHASLEVEARVEKVVGA